MSPGELMAVPPGLVIGWLLLRLLRNDRRWLAWALMLAALPGLFAGLVWWSAGSIATAGFVVAVAFGTWAAYLIAARGAKSIRGNRSRVQA
jgi:hypothetical protein